MLTVIYFTNFVLP